MVKYDYTEEQKLKLEQDFDKAIKYVQCPQCRKKFILSWDDGTYSIETLIMRGCPSGGIYDVSIHCPYCNYEEEL